MRSNIILSRKTICDAKALWLGFVLSFLFSCKKDSTGPQAPPSNPPPVSPAPPPPAISGISPVSGPMATVVTITGSNFNPDSTKDKIWFNNIPGTVQHATATSLTVTVPTSAGTGAVTLSTGGTTVTGPVFTYEYTLMVTTVAGNGTAGMINGAGTVAELNSPVGIAFNPSGNILYIADAGNNNIRGMTAGAVSTFAGSPTAGYSEGNGTNASFHLPFAVATDAAGNLYVADAQNNVVRKISGTGTVSTLAGGGNAAFADGAGTNAGFDSPAGIAVDSAGNVFVADLNNQRIRKVTAGGVVTTLAGTNTLGFADGTGSAAIFTNPAGLCVDHQGNIYVADAGNNRIRKVTAAGVVTTVAGSGSHGYADGNTTTAKFYGPSDVAMDANGNIYVTDTYNAVIRMITPSGTVSTVAGTAGISGFKDGTANTALFNHPSGIILDTSGNIYVSDNSNNRIRKIMKQ